MMMDLPNNNTKGTIVERTKWTHWTYLSYCSKFAKLSTNLRFFDQFLSRCMSSDLSTDTGHPSLFECSTIQYNNSFFNILEPISCVKSVLKSVKVRKIKKFYLNEDVSTVSIVTSKVKKENP